MFIASLLETFITIIHFPISNRPVGWVMKAIVKSISHSCLQSSQLNEKKLIDLLSKEMMYHPNNAFLYYVNPVRSHNWLLWVFSSKIWRQQVVLYTWINAQLGQWSQMFYLSMNLLDYIRFVIRWIVLFLVAWDYTWLGIVLVAVGVLDLLSLNGFYDFFDQIDRINFKVMIQNRVTHICTAYDW